MSEAARKFHKMPKVQLHHHLDCSLRLETVWDLANENNIKLKSKNLQDLFNEYKIVKQHKNLDDVLDRFLLCSKVLVNFEAIIRVDFENVEDAYRQNIKLLELRFSPSFISLNKKLGQSEILEAILEGVWAGMQKYPIEVGLICTLTREFDFATNVQAVDHFIKYKKSSHPLASRLIGIDLAGQELSAPPEKFSELLEKARDFDLKLTIHSGEDTSSDALKRTLEVLKPERIGHGIKAIDDPEVMNLLKEQDVLLEVCPISNWLTCSVEDMQDHPMKKLFDSGIKVCLNTDDPQIFDIDLNQEYNNAFKYWKFTEQEFMLMNMWAIEKSFLPGPVKEKVLEEFSLSRTPAQNLSH